uniref:Uncharacterized protein n=1 Tax=Rhizophora mucronata TaxID=61149 RepID=A0A2P2R380_RHIMU
MFLQICFFLSSVFLVSLLFLSFGPYETYGKLIHNLKHHSIACKSFWKTTCH